MYGKNEHKFIDKSQVQCMIKGYQAKYKSDSCDSFKRDYSKRIEVKSIHNVKKGF